MFRYVGVIAPHPALNSTPRNSLDGHALWRFVPLYAGGDVAAQARRVAVFCDAYGIARPGLMRVVARRQRALRDSVKAWAAAGVPAFVAMWRGGHTDGTEADAEHVLRHRIALERG